MEEESNNFKILICSDTHLGAHEKSQKLQDDCYLAFEEISIIKIGEGFFLNIFADIKLPATKMPRIAKSLKSADISELTLVIPTTVLRNKVTAVAKIKPTTQGRIPLRNA